MQISVQFNWPVDKATLLVGGPSVNDHEREFFVGIIRSNGKNQKKDWFSADKTEPARVLLDRKDSFVVEARDKESQEVTDSMKFSVEREWPADAVGGTHTDRSLAYI
jgi:hypothetical protein